MNKKLLFLYPIREYMGDFDNDTIMALNKAIELRYRRNGYQIYYAIFPDTQEIKLCSNVSIIKTNISLAVMTFYLRYPSAPRMIKQLGEVDKLIVCGFHLTDCVQKVAKEAIKRKINTMIDMDLCELFPEIIYDSDFDIGNYNEEYTRKILNKLLGLEYRKLIEPLNTTKQKVLLKK